MKQSIELFKNRPFEVKISLLVCLLGMLRTGAGVVGDLITNIVVAELLTDSGLFITFSSLFYIAFTRPTFKGIHPAIGIVMIIFLGFNFIEFAGVAGNSEFNVLSAILAFACLFSGRWMYALTFLIVAVTVALQITILYNEEFKQSFFLYSSNQYNDFIFSIVCVIMITTLLKELAISEQNKLDSKIDELNSNVALAKTTNQMLIQKHQELAQAKAALEQEVQKRTHRLNQQNTAIEKYIYYNTEELKNPLTELLTSVDSYKGDSPLFPLLQISSTELKSVMNTINEALTSDQKLDRSKLR